MGGVVVMDGRLLDEVVGREVGEDGESKAKNKIIDDRSFIHLPKAASGVRGVDHSADFSTVLDFHGRQSTLASLLFSPISCELRLEIAP